MRLRLNIRVRGSERRFVVSLHGLPRAILVKSSVMRLTITFVALTCLAICGCTSQFGVAVINRSGNDLKDVTIQTDPQNGETAKSAITNLDDGAFAASYSRAYRNSATVTWTPAGMPTVQRRVTPEIPSSFDGYVCFIILKDDVQLELVKNSTDAFVPPN
jgi:hypothetical protein